MNAENLEIRSLRIYDKTTGACYAKIVWNSFIGCYQTQYGRGENHKNFNGDFPEDLLPKIAEHIDFLNWKSK